MEMEWSEETILVYFWNYLQAFQKHPSNLPFHAFAHHQKVVVTIDVLIFQVRISRGNDLPKPAKPTLCQQH